MEKLREGAVGGAGVVDVEDVPFIRESQVVHILLWSPPSVDIFKERSFLVLPYATH